MDEAPISWTDEMQLVPHPDLPSPEGVTFTARAGRTGGVLYLQFSQFGDEQDQLVLVQPPGSHGRTDELWKHTCFEGFVRVGDESGYAEFNFSNWGEWAAYRFDGPRQGRRDLVALTEPTAYLAYKGDGGDGVFHRLFGTADLFDESKAWRVGLSAVIELKDGTKSYWALAHPPGAPDFHHPACFVATLPAPERA